MCRLSRAESSLTFQHLQSEISINTDIWRDKNISHEKPKDFFGDYNTSYLETLNEKLPYGNETIDKNTENNQTKAVKNEIFTNTVTHLMAVFSGDQM